MAMMLATRRRASWTGRDHLKAILDGLPVSAFVCDCDLTIVYATPAAQRMMQALRSAVMTRFRINVDELVGTSVERFVSGSGTSMGRVQQILRTPGALPYVARFELGGEQLQATISAAPNESGEPIGYIATIEAVTRDTTAGAALRGAAAEASESSVRMAVLTEDLDVTSTEVSGRSTELTGGVEELLALMSSVADGADMIRTSTLAVVDSTKSANSSVSELNESTSKIGDFAALITSIAEQTKLLALNATIEATRAGEAGRGFAVVAKEVKDLAQRARSATDQVSDIIAAIQATSGAAGKALSTIMSGIDTVGGQQLSVNEIVDKQVKQVDVIASMARDLAGSVGTLTSSSASTRESAVSLSQRMREFDHLTASAE